MTPYLVQGPTRICAATGRSLTPGEKYYSVLVEDAQKTIRRDYAADAWQGPPDSFIAYWSSRVPTSNATRKPNWNEEVLADWFHHLEGRVEQDRLKFRYVVALILMRRKRFKFEDVQRTETDGVEQSFLVVRDAKNGKRYEIADPQLTEADMDAVQDEVFRVLGWD